MRYFTTMRLLACEALALALGLFGCSTDAFTNPADAGTEGGTDAALEASSDGGLPDALVDGSADSGVAPCPRTTTTSCNNSCGGSGVDGGFVVGACCVPSTGVGACALACTGASFPCLGPTDCVDVSKPICCLTGSSQNPNVCPRLYGTNVDSACTSTNGCTGRRLCTTDAECPSTGHCLQAEINGTTSKFEFGVCSI